MSSENKSLIESFYTAFKNHDAEAMVEHYHPNVSFKDPAFGELRGEEAKAMWRMLIARAKGNLSIQFSNIKVQGNSGTANWEAIYPFSQSGRTVHNKIKATFQFKEGKIIRHQDEFSLWKWSSMALGPIGTFLGFTPMVQNKIRKQARRSLEKYMSENSA